MAGSELARILAAARDGRVSAAGAVRWAQRAAAGEDIAFIDQLARAGTPVGAADATRLASRLAAILAGSRGAADTAARDRAGEISDTEADALYPPRTAADAARRISAAQSERSRRRDYTEDELHAELFGTHVHAAGDDQPADDSDTGPGHEAFTGTHTHDHPAYQLGDGQGGALSAAAGDTYAHKHAHYGGASHDHHGGQAPVVPGPVSRR